MAAEKIMAARLVRDDGHLEVLRRLLLLGIGRIDLDLVDEPRRLLLREAPRLHDAVEEVPPGAELHDQIYPEVVLICFQ